jgi:hypothetical protein
MVRRCHFHARPNANLWMEFRRHGHARLANEWQSWSPASPEPLAEDGAPQSLLRALQSPSRHFGEAMNGLVRETRIEVMVDNEELAAIDDWRFKQRMPSRSAAVRHLMWLGLQVEADDTDSRPLRSQSFGVVAKRDPSQA